MTLRAELIELQADDGVEMIAALWEPEGPANSRGVDAWLLLPGTMGTFYSKNQQAFVADYVAAGYPVLTLNTRGHDMVARNRPDGRYVGFGYEIISECPNDISPALGLLQSRGYQRLGLFGHSLGAVKGFYYLSE